MIQNICKNIEKDYCLWLDIVIMKSNNNIIEKINLNKKLKYVNIEKLYEIKIEKLLEDHKKEYIEFNTIITESIESWLKIDNNYDEIINDNVVYIKLLYEYLNKNHSTFKINFQNYIFEKKIYYDKLLFFQKINFTL